MRTKQKISFLLACAILICILFSSAFAAGQTATVRGGWLVLRESPSFSGAILASYPSGTVVTVKSSYGSWYAVTTPDNMSGYMLSNFLTLSGSSGSGTGDVTEYTAYVTSANGLNVRLRSGPGTGYSILASYAPGTICRVLSEGTDWSRIQVGTLSGYMMNRFLTRSYPAPTVPPYVPVTPTTVPEDGYTVFVTSYNGQGVNLRAGPGKNYQSIGFYSVGTQGSMISPGGEWSYIRIGNRYGYMMSQFLSTSYIQPIQPVHQTGAYVISANGRNVNLRSGPGKGFGVIRSFPVGTELKVIVRGSEWYYIQIGGIYGYMMKAYIHDGQSPQPISPVYPVDETEQHIIGVNEDTVLSVTTR